MGRPRSKLPQALRRIRQIGDQYGFQIGNIFHAGDGNLHPIVLYDPRDAAQFQRALKASAESSLLRRSRRRAYREHGVGMEKSELMPLLFSDADFDLMRRVHDAFIPTPPSIPAKSSP